MGELLRENLVVIRFVYGLIFFALGFAIVLQPRRQSVYYLATALSWLAAFAIVHALADWGLVFIPQHGTALAKPAMIVRSAGLIVSFGLLMQFGMSLLLEHHPRRATLSLIPSAMTGVFVLLMLLAEFSPSALPWSSQDVRVLTRFSMGVSSSLLSAWGLLRQVPSLRADRRSHIGHLYGAVACFVLYAGVGGLVTPKGSLLLAPWLNEETFFRTMSVPVEVARGLSVLGITYFTVRLLDIFHQETQRRLHVAEQDRALLRERERIARELHDGIMQTLYGTGLGLKQVNALAQTQPDQAQVILTELNREIGRAIVQMRRFVLDLKEQTISGAELVEDVRSTALQVGQFAGLQVSFQDDLTGWGETPIPAGLREEVLAIIREALSNVVRHSQATSVQIMVALDDDTVLVRLSDNGHGFDPAATESGRGLDTMKERVENVGGFIQVLSTPGEGTQLVAHLPVASRSSRQKELSAS